MLSAGGAALRTRNCTSATAEVATPSEAWAWRSWRPSARAIVSTKRDQGAAPWAGIQGPWSTRTDTVTGSPSGSLTAPETRRMPLTFSRLAGDVMASVGGWLGRAGATSTRTNATARDPPGGWTWASRRRGVATSGRRLRSYMPSWPKPGEPSPLTGNGLTGTVSVVTGVPSSKRPVIVAVGAGLPNASRTVTESSETRPAWIELGLDSARAPFAVGTASVRAPTPGHVTAKDTCPAPEGTRPETVATPVDGS